MKIATTMGAYQTDGKLMVPEPQAIRLIGTRIHTHIGREDADPSYRVEQAAAGWIRADATARPSLKDQGLSGAPCESARGTRLTIHSCQDAAHKPRSACDAIERGRSQHEFV